MTPEEMLTRAEALRAMADGYLLARTSLGRGFRSLTDEYLTKADILRTMATEYEQQAAKTSEEITRLRTENEQLREQVDTARAIIERQYH